MLLQAVIFMNLALLFYSWAVFSARRRGLRRGHLLIFGLGLLADYLGTHLMFRYGLATGFVPRWHTILGLGSLYGMAFHFVLALLAATTRHEHRVNRLFHRVSLTIYTGWLLSFFTGAVAGIHASY